MKIRALHPEFFADPDVARLSPLARLLFAGLWCHSDDYGRNRWLPKRIEGDIFPHDDVDILALLDELVSAALVVVYDIDGAMFFQVRSWEKYQKPKYRAAQLAPPPPDTPGQLGTDLEPILGQPGTELAQQEEGEGEVLEEVLVLAPKPARDEVWDTLADLFGEPTTQTNRTLRGKVVKSLANAGANDESIRLRCRAWPHHFDVTLTETALEKHWDRLGKPVARASKADVAREQRRMSIEGAR